MFIFIIKIYIYCFNKGFTEESIKSAALLFKRRNVNIKKIIDNVQRALNKEEVDEE